MKLHVVICHVFEQMPLEGGCSPSNFILCVEIDVIVRVRLLLPV